ncbi:hypothetical protein BDW22DRAFT_247267 [Trametopsis cervina]|nr:hypothetical protein BDW22DRAFT_247267 [Trametopsis cervina]
MATTHALDSIQSLLEQHLPINKITIPSNADAEFAKVTSWTAALYLSVGSRGFRRVPSLPWEPLDKRQEVFVQVALSVPSAPGLRALLHLTCHLCRKSQLDLVQSISSVKSVVEPFFTKLELADSFESDNYNAPWRKVLNEGSLRDAIGFLTNLLRDDTAAQDGEWSDTQHDALLLIIKLIASNPWGFQDSIAAVRRMTLSSKSDAVVVKILTLFIKSYPDSFNRHVRHEDFYTDTAALSRVAAAIEIIATNSPDQLTRLSVLKACHSLACSLYHARDDVKGTALTKSWRGVFAAFTSLVQAATMLEGGMDVEPEWIHSCFIALSGLDAENEYRDRDDDEKYSAWRAAFKPEESFVPDGFYLALMDISIPEERFWRMRRLQEMTAEERQAAKKDIEPYLRKRAADNLDNSAAGPSTERGEGSGGGAGAVDGSGQADVAGEVKEREDSSDDTDRVDVAREAEGHADFGNNPEVDAEELELDTDVAPARESDGHELAADNGLRPEQDEATSKDTAALNLEAVGLPHTKPSEDALPEAAELSDTKSPNDASPEAETIADNPEGLFDTEDGPQGLGPAKEGGGQVGVNLVGELRDDSDIVENKDDEQVPGISGDGGE